MVLNLTGPLLCLVSHRAPFSVHFCSPCIPVGIDSQIRIYEDEKVQVGKDQEKAQSEKDSHSKNRGGKKPN